ncbi:MAG TPA: alpha/beta fold hydrolase, partial [Acidimicrobiales bacterium]|nr:alpha/beta fold hydrolase [Acidimicrobiales bacterium]
MLGPVGGPATALPARPGVRAPAVPATPGPVPAGAVFAVARPPVATARAAPADGGRRAVDYRPPVDAPIGDAFRPPPTPYGAGNRGVDYATVEGQPVWAAAPGQVVFAGPVGGSLHVTILHPDGLRSSYSFLRSVAVRRGDAVEQGQVVGTARGSGLHVGARAGDAYLDPLALFGPGSGRARLVADPDDSVPLGEAAERAGLVESLRHAARAMGGATREAVAWLEARVAAGVAQRAELARILASDAVSLSMPPALHLGVAALAWAAEQEGCTPAGTPAPASGGRRLVVLVGGLGSSSDRAAAFTVDTAGLGYGPGDVHRFSYRAGGGPYAPADTQGNIGAAAALLAAQLDDLGRLHPGVPLDVVAHSQGGLVARAALLHHRPAGVATLVTLGTPHRGTDLATAAAGIAATGPGHALLRAAGALPVPIDPGATSVL